jgi:hypothetical protein
VDPTEDASGASVVADHAYWASRLSVRDPKKSQTGTFDARSEGFGVGDGKPDGVKQGAGTIDGGVHGPTPYVERSQDWTAAPTEPVADRLDVVAANISTATVDAARARLSCAPQLNVKSDGPLDLRIDCAKAVVKSSRCSNRVSFRLPSVKGARITRVAVTRRGKVLARAKARNLRTITIRRPSLKSFKVRLELTTTRKNKRITVIRAVSAC